MKITDLRKLINEEIQYVLNEAANRAPGGSPGGRNIQMGTPKGGKGGRRYISPVVAFPKDIISKFPEKDFQLLKNKEGEYSMYISPYLFAAMQKGAKIGKYENIFNALPADKPWLKQQLKQIFKSAGSINPQVTKKGANPGGMHSINVKIKDVTPDGDIIFVNPQNAGEDSSTKYITENIINEVMDALMAEEAHNPIDEIGKFFVAKKPKKGMTKEEMVYEATAFDTISPEETLGIYKNKSEANRLAGESLKAFEDQLKEVESSMEEIRKDREAIKAKAQAAKDKINKIK
jgi:hypothetical protein